MCKKYFIEILKKLLTKAISHIIINRLSKREQSPAQVCMLFIYMAVQLSWLEYSVHTRLVVGSNPTAATNSTHLPTKVFLYRVFTRTIEYGPVVKRLRHRPFTAVTRVRFSSGSPQSTCNKQVLFSFVFLQGKNRESNSIIHLSAVRRWRSRKGYKIGYLRSKSSRLALTILVRVTKKIRTRKCTDFYFFTIHY